MKRACTWALALGFGWVAAMMGDLGAASEAAAQAPGEAFGGAATVELERRHGRLPLRYEENQGQHDARARYVARQGGLTLFATGEGPVVAVRVPEGPAADEAGALGDELGQVGRAERLARAGRPDRAERPERIASFRIALEGARANAPIEAGAALITRSNYFIGADPDRWRTNIPNYASVTYREVAPGVDLVLHSSPEGLIEYDFVVAPGVSPTLTVRFEGAERVTLGAAGALEIHVGGAIVEQPAPVLYQEIGGRRVPVEGGYRLAGGDRVRFDVGAYDPNHRLVIDPVLVYGTYLGGSEDERLYGLAVDASGASYVVGQTESTNFPTADSIQDSFGGGSWDAFVAKLSPAGDALVYATYLGGSANDYAHGIAVDASGAAYVAGGTASTNFPTANAFQSSYAGGGSGDAFVAKLSPAGDALLYATYLGGSASSDYAHGVAVDASGAAYVSGVTYSTDFPIKDALQSSYAGGDGNAFVTKLSPAGDSLAYSTFLGGSGDDDFLTRIAIDASGAAYLVGSTTSADFPTAYPVQGSNAGSLDVFVAKLTPQGHALVYSTYLGGSSSDSAHAIAVDATGAVYVTGRTISTDFPTSNPFQSSNAGSFDVFVAKLTPAGDALVYSTYLGGSSHDLGYAIAVDALGAAYVAGQTGSTDFPTSNPFQGSNAGGIDAFVAMLTPSGDALAYATYLGGSSDDRGRGIALDATGAVYVAGYTNSTDFPTANHYQYAAGRADGFIVKLGSLRAADGVSCADASECASGFCADGVCCDAPCAGGASDCLACSVAAGAAVDGSCGPTTGNACDDGLACTVDSVCSAGACGGGTSPCAALTSCDEAGGGAYVCGACPAGTSSADGTGQTACETCAHGTWSSEGATICAAWTACGEDEFEAAPPSATSDRECTPAGPCGPNEYEASPPTETEDRVCAAYTVCSEGEYQAVAPTGTSDRECAAYTVCAADEWESAAPTATSDRTCAAYTVCAADEWESAAPTATSDRTCAAHTVCATDEWESAAPTATSDRTCALVTVCGDDAYELTPPTATSDRACAPCAQCGAGQIEVLGCGPDADTVCEPDDVQPGGGHTGAGSDSSGCAGAGGGGGPAALMLLAMLALALRRDARSGGRSAM